MRLIELKNITINPKAIQSIRLRDAEVRIDFWNGSDQHILSFASPDDAAKGYKKLITCWDYALCAQGFTSP